MDLWIFLKTVFSHDRDRCEPIRDSKAENQIQIRGEAGEVVLPLVLALVTASFLFGSLFWLNKHYENKTQEHLSDFRKDWNRLGQKYKE